jgi:hypothetical protein
MPRRKKPSLPAGLAAVAAQLMQLLNRSRIVAQRKNHEEQP